MRYILSILGVIVFLVIVIVIIASSHPKALNSSIINLSNYNTPLTSVSEIISGELVGDDQRQAIEITISQSSRVINILNGYNQTVGSSESFENNPTAYQIFLGALKNYDFTTPKATKEMNMFGVCPQGDTYQFILNSNGSDVSDLWTTGCNPIVDGNFGGNADVIKQLFAMQISNYDDFTGNLLYVTN